MEDSARSGGGRRYSLLWPIWEAPPESKRERGTFVRLQVNERVENPLVEIYQRTAQGNLSF